jgi:hypothetical protein
MTTRPFDRNTIRALVGLTSLTLTLACNSSDDTVATGTGASYASSGSEDGASTDGGVESSGADSESSSGGEDAGEAGESGESTTGEETGGGSGQAGDDCEEDADCESEICVEPSPGSGESICAELCDPFCADGFTCVNLMTSMGSADVCVPAPDNLCDPCVTNNDCGDGNDFCVSLAAGDFCVEDCTGNPDSCPVGFTCGLITGSDAVAGMQCIPDNGVCCIDADGDIHGEGAGCLGTDCDDDDDEVYPGADELCDDKDNDCNDIVDDDTIDCPGANCSVGVLGYFEEGAATCEAGGNCVVPDASLCNLYTCDEGGENGDACADACDVEDDLKCIPAAHCDASECFDDLANGLGCDEDSDCVSAHCDNLFCCDLGNCCQVASDCPNFGTGTPICDNPATCQGTTGEATCSANFQCGTDDGVANDTGCDAATLADDCGLFIDVYCDGTIDQNAPECLTQCSTHADCDDTAFCNPGTQQCELKRDDGEVCEFDDNAWCVADHCENGFCCGSGDCCSAATDCPASYSSDPVCTTPSACQGTFDQAQCIGSICSTAANSPDDSACTSGMESDDCGSYLSVYCDGSAMQLDPDCATFCTGDSDCDPEAYCNTGAACVPDEDNGQACNDDAECVSAHCQNGFCCDSGDCCADSNDCGDYVVTPNCTDASTCSGVRTDGVCSVNFQCSGQVVADQSGCNGLESDDCGPYLATQCPDTSCDTSCIDDNDCDPSANCTLGECVPDAGPGGFCNDPSDCSAGLFCVDSVCCASACDGSCEACDLIGAEGTCQLVPDGQDPDNECGTLSCAGYYWGWGPDAATDRDKCYQRADVDAATATCGGDGACRDASESCPTQGQGGVDLDCDDSCQEGDLLSCSGTNAGACLNLNLGTETCGDGPCEVTVNKCESGVPQTCTENTAAASTETCNDIDDNCDGTIDNGSFGDSYENNGSCGTYANIPDLGSNDSNSINTLTIYNDGDWDYFKADLVEDDSTCYCNGSGDLSKIGQDEDYRITVRLTVPPNAGTYEFCVDSTDCTDLDVTPNNWCTNVSAGNTGTLQWYRDGCCSGLAGCNGADSYDLWIRVRGVGGTAYECSPYTLEYEFDAGYCL